VESGRYNSASEVLEAAIDALEREECDDEAKELYLEQALEAGFSSGATEGDVVGRIRARHSLSVEFTEFVTERVKSGRYANGKDVLDAAMGALKQNEADDDLDIEYVKQAIAEGEASGVYEGDPFADLRAKYNLPQKA
jgi:putative addiction module CopG family antidote